MLPRSVSPLPLGSDLPPLRVFGRPRRSDSPAPSLSSSSSLGLDGVQPTSSSSSYVDHDGYTITTSVEGEGTITPHRNGHQPASAPEHQQAEHHQQLPTAFRLLQPISASSFSPSLPHEVRGAAGPGSYPPSASLSALAHSKLMDPFSSGIVGFPMMASASTTASSASAHPPPSAASLARFSSLIDGLDTVQPTATTTRTTSNSGGHYGRSMATTTTTPSHLPFPLSRDLHPPSPSPSHFSAFHALPPPPAYDGQPTSSSSTSSASAFQPLPAYGSSFMPPLHHPRTSSPSPSSLQQQLHQPQPPHFPASRGAATSPPPPYALGPSSDPQYYGHNLHQRPTSAPTMTAAAFAPPTQTSASTTPAGHASSSSLHFASSGMSPSPLPSPSTTSSCQPSASPRGEPSCPEFQLNLPTLQADAELIEEVYIFGQNYKAHCRELYRATREGLFALAQENVARFWPMVGRFQRLLSLHAVIEQIVRFDKLFYEALVEAAVAGIDNRRIDSARAVLGFAQSLPSWTFHAASRSLPPSLFHPKMTLLKRSAREMMLRAQIYYFGGLLAAVFNEGVLGRPVTQVLADPHLHLAAAQIALAADGGDTTQLPHAKRPRTAGKNSDGYYDQHHLSTGGSGCGEESSNDAWSVKSSNSFQHGVKQEGEGAASFGNPLKRSRDGNGSGWADKSNAGENETALVIQKMFEDWSNLNTQDLVTDMMHQHGATSLWGVVTFSPVLVSRLIADQLERKSRIEHWFASFVEAYLIKDLLLDHRDTNSAWYAAVPFTNKDGTANAFSDPTIDASSVSGGSRNTIKLLSDSHVFCMQWRCFSSQVLRRLESNRASTGAMFSILFAWIDALLDFFLDKRRAQFLSLSTTKRSTAAGAPHEVASSPSLAGSSNGRSDTPVHFPASSPAPERSGAHHAPAAAELHRRQQQQHQFHQYSPQYHQQPGGGGGAGGASAAMPTPDPRQHVPLRPFPNQQHYYHELLQQHHQQQVHAMMTAQAQHRASPSPSTTGATTTPIESPSQAPSAASQHVPSSPGSAGFRTSLSPRQPPAKRQRSPTAPTTAATPPTLTSHLFQFKQKPTPSPTSQPSQDSPRLGMSSPSLPTVPSKLRSPSEVMSQLGLPQSLLVRMQRNVATSTPPTSSSSTSSSASGSESSASTDSARRKSAGAQVSYSSESSPVIPSSPPSSPASPGASSSSSSSTSSFTAPRYVVQR